MRTICLHNATVYTGITILEKSTVIINDSKISDVISYYVHSAIKKEISVPQALARATNVINSKEVLIR